MEDTFLCFEIEAALFLLSLECVNHIIPGDDGESGFVSYNAQNARLVDFGILSGVNRHRKYVVLLNAGEEFLGIPADEIKGIFEISSDKMLKIPKEAVSRRNSFLEQAVHMESLNSWAFIVKPETAAAAERY